MKRKVQAQRKFAQGAYVPPLHTNNSLERRVDLVGKDEQRNTTTIHNMSANMLLDVVSFSNLHVHNKKLEPIVRLERLKKFQDPPAPQPTENTEPRRSPRAPKRLLVPKSKFPVRNLRKKRSKLKEIKRVQPRRPLRKRILDTQDNDEDNTPLKFFAKASKFSLLEEPATAESFPDRPQTAYYGANEIQRWIYNSIQNRQEEEDAGFKVPALPEASIYSGDVDGTKTPPLFYSATPSVCPSERYSTVKAVVSALSQDLERRCKNCSSCARVNKVEQLSHLVQRQRPVATAPGNDDIYEFDANDDDAVERPRLNHFRQNRNAARQRDPSAILSVTEGDDNYLYLDLLPEKSTHIIQIMSTKIPNQNKQMLRARLMPKSLANSRNEFSLIEHENLLDQLLETLNMSIHSKNKMTASRDQPVANTPINNEGSSVSIPPLSIAPTPVLPSPPNSSREKNSTSRPSTSKMATRGTPLASNRNTKTTVVDKEPLKKGRDRESTATTSKRAKSNTQKETQSGILMDAPIYYPTEEEFTDPLAYFTKIMPAASKHGLCKVVAPKGFKPTCTLKNEIRFNVSNQYIARLYSRWGPAAMEMCAIKTYLASQSVLFNRAPLVNSLEVNLPKLYHVVQRHGGLKNVMEKKRWGRVADELRIGRGCNPEKLDLLYLRYLLPYDTLSHNERQQMMGSVEKGWKRKNRKMLERASNPLHRQKRLLGETESSGEDTEEDSDMVAALAEAEDCVVPGRNMTLATFTKAAAAAQESYYGRANSPRPAGVEEEYWRLVLLGADHVCVYTASIDTGDEGYGFPTDKNDPYGTHPWNLKMISQNEGNVLRSLGPVLGVTVPTLHLGMMFSTSCWHRDPHGLPWMEYMHRGPHKIWYGIPDEQSSNFRKAVESLCPTSCQNKSIWLPSDITMIPPHLLREHNVTLSRVEQAPGEYVIVFPKAYSCSISTGYTQSESVYFATNTWLNGVDQVFQELRESCEPTMFSLEQLLLAIASDSRSSARVLRLISSSLGRIVADELDRRRQLARLGLTSASADSTSSSRRKRPVGAWNIREQDECEICRATLYLSKVTGVTGKKSAVCLQHALRLLDTQRKGETRANLVCFYSEDELSEVICALKTRLDDNRFHDYAGVCEWRSDKDLTSLNSLTPSLLPSVTENDLAKQTSPIPGIFGINMRYLARRPSIRSSDSDKTNIENSPSILQREQLSPSLTFSTKISKSLVDYSSTDSDCTKLNIPVESPRAVADYIMKKENEKERGNTQKIKKKKAQEKTIKNKLNKEVEIDPNDRWYYHACNTESFEDMRQYQGCQKWFHEQCVGLTKDGVDFMCPYCN
ncbi:jumonji, AT rich interactive domain 2 [Aphomia sociella]